MADVIGFYREYDDYGCFSNFYGAPFEFEGEKFRWSEQMIMWQKARLFGDSETAHAILLAKRPLYAKRLGREVTPYNDKVWSAKREELVVPGLYAKFKQHPDICDILLGTGDAIIAECSPYDRIWGIGLSVGHPDVSNSKLWRGTNLLGQYLMKVREMLRKEVFAT